MSRNLTFGLAVALGVGLLGVALFASMGDDDQETEETLEADESFVPRFI